MIEIVISIILIVLGPIVDAFVYGLMHVFLFPLISLLLIRHYNFKIAIVVITMVSLALDSLLHLNLGSFLLSFSGAILFDFFINMVLPKDDPILHFLNNFLNFTVFNFLLMVFRAVSFGENLSGQINLSTVSLVFISSLLMSILYLLLQNSIQVLQGRERGHMIRIK